MITPHQLAADGSEHAHQKAFFQWIAVSGAKRFPDLLMCHAVPNGAKLMGTGTARGRSEGARMKAEGLRPGVPDVFLPVSRLGMYRVYVCYHGLWIELKRPGREHEKVDGVDTGGRSDEQVKWQAGLIKQGYAVATAYGWMPACLVLIAYMEGRLIMPETDCIMAIGTDEPPWY